MIKEHKAAMKETIRMMKANATTPEDWMAIKELKSHMKAEIKHEWKGFQELKKSFKKNHKDAKYATERLMAKHVADLTIPDNSELPANTHAIKTWKLLNPGTVAWPAGCELRIVSKHGDSLNGPERVVLDRPVEPQQEVDVSVPFITPAEPGRYVAYYRMATPEGAKFGQRMWVSFVVPTTPAQDVAMTQ